MKFLEYWKPKLLEEIENTLSKYQSNTPWNDKVRNHLSTMTTKGKSLRGSLFLETLTIFTNVQQAQKYISIAASIELLHLSLIIHDDIMDNDLLRRGLPTIHSQYKPKKFGNSLAICTGDIGFFIAIGGFASLLPQAHHYAISEMVNIGCGQIEDLYFTYTQDQISWEQIIKMYTNKTSRYTFVFPIILAMKITQESENLQSLYQELALNLGILFQITDDSLSLFGDKKDIGKSTGNDLLEEKKTLYWYLLYQTELNYIFKNKNINLKKIQDKIKESDAFEKIRLFKTKILAESEDLIQKIPKGKDLFQKVLHFTVNRNY